MYVELHCHSAYSFLDGASLPEDLAERAHDLGYKALALTDHDGFYGSMEFARKAKLMGVRPITGVEMTMEGGFHLTLLVESKQGYAHLCRLLSRAHLDHPRGDPSVSYEQLYDQHEGLIVLTGCSKGKAGVLVDQGKYKEALEHIRVLTDVFGQDRVWVELQQNFVRGDTERIRQLVTIAREIGVGIVATNNVHYDVRERHKLHDVLTAIKHQRTLDLSHQVRRANSEFYLKSPEEMQQIFAELPEAIRASITIAERCQFDLTADLGYTFPNFEGNGDHGADRHLSDVCRNLLKERYDQSCPDTYEKAKKRLTEELDLIRHHGLSGFFLVYRDLLRLANEVAEEVRSPSMARRAARLPPGRGRGSSVSSLVCYLIGLSHVDPIKNNLSIDRFLNDNLHAVPDIDLDFARDIREQLILKVCEHYGEEYAALVCSFSTYRLRSAVRDVGKALGLPKEDLERLAQLSDRGNAKDLKEVMLSLPEFKSRVEDPAWQDLIHLAGEIAGLPRHISQHVGGIVISSRPLVELVPLEKARMPGRVICQWDKDSCEDAGFIKVDFLSLGMLSLVEEAVEHIVAGRMEDGLPPLDLSRIPMDDPAVFQSISKGDTIGLFQIESRAQIQLLPRTRPQNIDDLAIGIALIRPGPIIGGAVHPYVERREAERTAKKRGQMYVPPYDHPLLEPVLRETLGVILYQDHVLHVAVALADFTPGEAEQLRRALGRKNTEREIEMLKQRFLSGAKQKGVAEDVALHVFQKLMAFSQFGFPKSHSYAFAVLAYQSAWIKQYYPAEYVAALLNNQPMGFYPPHVIVRDAQRHGVDILDPDINQSGVKCSVHRSSVIIGLSYIKGISEDDAKKIVSARRDGPFTSIEQFVRRVDLPRRQIERLIAAGAFQQLGGGRREAMWQMGLTLTSESLGSAGHKQARAHQLPLPLSYTGPSVDLPSMTRWEEILTDYGSTGLTAKEHLMHVLRSELTRHAVTLHSLTDVKSGTSVHLAGVVTTRQRPSTAKGVLFLLLEDETGMVNVVIRPDLYERKKAVIRGEQLVMIRGELQRREQVMSVLAWDIWPLWRFLDRPERFFTRRKEMSMPSSHDFH